MNQPIHNQNNKLKIFYVICMQFVKRSEKKAREKKWSETKMPSRKRRDAKRFSTGFYLIWPMDWVELNSLLSFYDNFRKYNDIALVWFLVLKQLNGRNIDSFSLNGLKFVRKKCRRRRCSKSCRGKQWWNEFEWMNELTMMKNYPKSTPVHFLKTLDLKSIKRGISPPSLSFFRHFSRIFLA